MMPRFCVVAPSGLPPLSLDSTVQVCLPGIETSGSEAGPRTQSFPPPPRADRAPLWSVGWLWTACFRGTQRGRWMRSRAGIDPHALRASIGSRSCERTEGTAASRESSEYWTRKIPPAKLYQRMILRNQISFELLQESSLWVFSVALTFDVAVALAVAVSFLVVFEIRHIHIVIAHIHTRTSHYIVL